MLHNLQSIQGLVPIVGELESPVKSYYSNFTGIPRNQVSNWWSLVAEKADCISSAYWTGFDRYSVDEARYLVTTASGMVFENVTTQKNTP